MARTPSIADSRLIPFGAIVVVIAAAVLAPLAIRHEVDNRIEQWVNPNSEEAERYQEFLERFGSDEFVIVAYKGKPFFEYESLRLQVDVLERLEKIPAVASVIGIPSVFRDTFGMEDPDELEEELCNTDFYRNFVISQDGAMAGLIMETVPPDAIDGRKRLVGQIEAAVSPLRDAGWTTYIVGPPVLNVSLDETSKKEAGRLLPLSLLISSVVLFSFLRSFKALLIALICATATLTITVGLMAVFQRPMNMVTTSMPALVWVLSLSSLVHLLRTYLHDAGADCASRLRAAIEKTLRPCAISSVTTACGFFSLSVAPVRAVRDFGIFAGLGLLTSLVVAFTLAPVLIRWLKVPGRPTNRKPTTRLWIEGATRFATRRPAIVTALAALLLLIAGTALPGLRTESNPLSFLPADSEIPIAYRTVPEELTGLYSLELIVETPDSWLTRDNTRALDRLAIAIEKMPEVARVTSPVSYLRKLNQWDHDFDPAHYELPDSESRARSLLREADDSSLLTRFALADESAVRLAVLVKVMDSERFGQLVNRVAKLPEYNRLDVGMTGVILQLVRAQNDLLHAQIRSLGLAILLVFPCIFIGVRSLPLTLLSVIPNVVPILAAFALMAAAGIALDSATVMIAGIALGIAVDDTVHVLCAFTRAKRTSRDSSTAIVSALNEVGPAIAITTLTALAGFLVLLRSNFVPLQNFGMIVGFAIVVAFLADIILLPAVVTLFENFSRTKRDDSVEAVGETS